MKKRTKRKQVEKGVRSIKKKERKNSPKIFSLIPSQHIYNPGSLYWLLLPLSPPLPSCLFILGPPSLPPEKVGLPPHSLFLPAEDLTQLRAELAVTIVSWIVAERDPPAACLPTTMDVKLLALMALLAVATHVPSSNGESRDRRHIFSGLLFTRVLFDFFDRRNLAT